MTFTREVVFRPAYDHRNEGKGQHCVDMLFYLKGDKGVIQFMLMTGWSKGIIGLPSEHWDALHTSLNRADVWAPMPADLGYHSPVPMYENQGKMDHCELLPQGYCYYDGSGLNADRIFSLLVHEGSDAVWQALEQEYKLRFETKVAA